MISNRQNDSLEAPHSYDGVNSTNTPHPAHKQARVEQRPPSPDSLLSENSADKPTPSSTRKTSVVNPIPQETKITTPKYDVESDSCCVMTLLKIMALPVVFVAGFVFGAVYGAFCGVVHAYLLIQEAFTQDEIMNFCSPVQIILLSPLILIISSIVIAVCTVRYSGGCALVTPFLFCAKLLCDDGHHYESQVPMFERDPHCKHIPLFLWSVATEC